MNKLINYFNPIARLGCKEYSFIFPLISSLILVLVLEGYAHFITQNSESGGAFIILAHLTLILYFSFRDGMKGGLLTSVVAIAYYFYIIYSRNYDAERLTAAIPTILALAGIYLLISTVLGWLKETIDSLIESEANEKNRLKAILQQLPVGVIITDKFGKIVQSNHHIETILGRETRESVYDGSAHIKNVYFRGKLIPPSQWPLARALATGKEISSKEFIVKKEDGKSLYLQVSASLVKNDKGTTIAAASIINDITSQKEIESRKDEFINMASHELKTPITSLKLYHDLLQRKLSKLEDESALKLLASMKYQTGKLQELVSDLLEVTRIHAGKISLNKETFDLTELLTELTSELQATTRDHKILLEKSSKVYVSADKFRIYQVVTNIITNAIKYSPQGGKIIVKIKQENTKVVTSVQDEGIGIDEEQTKRIFDNLYQVTDSHEKTFPGLGMGLYISKEILKKHGGNISVKSQKGVGSTFYFWLPTTRRGKI